MTATATRKRSRKVLIVSHYYPPHLGGIEYVAQHQAKYLATAGCTVAVVTSSVSPGEKSTIADGVRVIRVKAWNGLQKQGIPFPVFSPRLLGVLIKEAKQADIVHIHDAFYLSSLVALVAARLSKKPVVLTQHVALIPHSSKLVNLIEKAVYATTGAGVFRFSSRILTLNDRVEAFLIAHRVNSAKIVQLPNGVDTELFRPAADQERDSIRKKYSLSQDRPIVLFVGRYVPKKGFDQLLASSSELYQLVFVGGTTKRKNSNDLAFLGELPQHKLAEVYRAADIFALPSEGEGFPLSVQEAMASGLPVVMKDDEGYKRYNLQKGLVWLLEDRSPVVIKDALASIIKDDKRYKEMSEYSLAYANSYFAWPGVIRRLNKLYDEVISEG
ncbi:MAG TPA: glycosyltransferase family 4 protein [Candidatus Saccharimonadales bacterium]|nr:glycosyltransferase family 4 protein [Candidatus Saccharimonadales bacterium]